VYVPYLVIQIMFCSICICCLPLSRHGLFPQSLATHSHQVPWHAQWSVMYILKWCANSTARTVCSAAVCRPFDAVSLATIFSLCACQMTPSGSILCSRSTRTGLGRMSPLRTVRKLRKQLLSSASQLLQLHPLRRTWTQPSSPLFLLSFHRHTLPTPRKSSFMQIASSSSGSWSGSPTSRMSGSPSSQPSLLNCSWMSSPSISCRIPRVPPRLPGVVALKVCHVSPKAPKLRAREDHLPRFTQFDSRFPEVSADSDV
jgi:hypothetical protein